MLITGTASISLSNPTIALHPASDGNVVTATRVDTAQNDSNNILYSGLININVGEAVSNEDILLALNTVAQQLAQQDALGTALVQTVITGSATSDKGTSVIALHPSSFIANSDGLNVYYTLSSVAGMSYNVNVGTCSHTDENSPQADLDAYALFVLESLQNQANAAAQAVRDAADAQVGISTLTGTGSATVTI